MKTEFPISVYFWGHLKIQNCTLPLQNASYQLVNRVISSTVYDLFTDLPSMSFQISNILKGDAGINLNHISINCSKKMASITE